MAGASDHAAFAACQQQLTQRVERRHGRLTDAGALAGLGGTNYVLGYKQYYEEGFAAGAGFLGIAVALENTGVIFNDDEATMAVLSYMATAHYATSRQSAQAELTGGEAHHPRGREHRVVSEADKRIDRADREPRGDDRADEFEHRRLRPCSRARA